MERARFDERRYGKRKHKTIIEYQPGVQTGTKQIELHGEMVTVRVFGPNTVALVQKPDAAYRGGSIMAWANGGNRQVPNKRKKG